MGTNINAQERLKQGMAGKTFPFEKNQSRFSATSHVNMADTFLEDERKTESSYIVPTFVENNISKDENSGVQNENIEKVYITTDYDMFDDYPKEELRLGLHIGIEKEMLKNSIEKHGVTTPIKVILSKEYQGRYNGDKPFLILGGHNRKQICKETGKQLPYIIIHGLSEEECDEIVAEEHFLNRQLNDLKPSEIKVLLKTIKRSAFNETMFIEQVNKNGSMKFSKASIYRYLKLDSLVEELLYKWVDTKKISLDAAYVLANCNKMNQNILVDFLNNWNITNVSKQQATQLDEKKLDKWEEEFLKGVFFPGKKIKNTVSIKLTDVKEIMPTDDWADAKNVIKRALKLYYEMEKGSK